MVSAIAIGNSGHLLASGQRSPQADIVVWNLETKEIVFRLRDHDVSVTALAFSPDDRILASAGDAQHDGFIIFWDMSTGKIVGRTRQAR